MYNITKKLTKKGKTRTISVLDFCRKVWGIKIIRFVTVGAFNTLLDITLLLVIVKNLGLPPIAANSLSASIAISVSYFLNHKIVFRLTSAYSIKKYLHFFLVTGLGVILIQDIVIYLVTDKFWVISSHNTYVVFGHTFYFKTLELVCAKILAVLIGLSWNFLLYKHVVFKDKKPRTENEDELVIG